MPESDWAVLSGPALKVAPRLLGCYLVRELHGQRLVGKIVETEAYEQTDPASHSFYGSTGRAAVTFGPAGHLYVHAIRHYFCCDVTCGQEGYGTSVLLRAIEPLEGIEAMRLTRHDAVDRQIANGPGKLCQAFGINKDLNGHNLRDVPLQLIINNPIAASQIVQTTRIGISKATDRPWRFYVKDSSFISKK